jgi:hypothetical protein
LIAIAEVCCLRAVGSPELFVYEARLLENGATAVKPKIEVGE